MLLTGTFWYYRQRDILFDRSYSVVSFLHNVVAKTQIIKLAVMPSRPSMTHSDFVNLTLFFLSLSLSDLSGKAGKSVNYVSQLFVCKFFFIRTDRRICSFMLFFQNEQKETSGKLTNFYLDLCVNRDIFYNSFCVMCWISIYLKLNMELQTLPVVMLENIVSFLSYDEIAKNRLVSNFCIIPGLVNLPIMH